MPEPPQPVSYRQNPFPTFPGACEILLIRHGQSEAFVDGTLFPLAGGSHPLVLAMLFVAEFWSGLGVMILDITAGAMMAGSIDALGCGKRTWAARQPWWRNVPVNGGWPAT